MDYLNTVSLLKEKKQEQLIKFYDELNESGKQSLLEQINELDFSKIDKLVSNKYSLNVKNMEPMNTVTVDDIKDREAYSKIGKKALIDGKMAIVILSGGQGSRLGFKHAKGMYNIGLTKTLSIFELHISRLVAFKEETGAYIHCFIMTSKQNNDEIEQFIKDNNYFGYNNDYIHYYIQGNCITMDKQFKIILSDKGTISYLPNGNGCWYNDLKKGGFKKLLDDNGIEYLDVVSVDNVLQNCADSAFLGSVIATDAGCGAKVVSKANKDERLGVICNNDGHPDVLEYYEIPDNLKGATTEDGKLVYNYGVILNYIFKVSELDKIDCDSLPVHMANKKTPYVDEEGNVVTPTVENAWKFEYLLTDLIARVSSCVSFEVEREKEFAPVKNLTGVDSVDTARDLLKKNHYEL